ALVSPQVELHGGVTYVDLSDSGSDTALDAGFRFNFNERFALGIAASWGDDVSIYSLAGRIYF
ncbi:MAG: hypothetical protein OEY04_17430, partial [Gammaproteobacteria bacterium]|nr:hypothetical protein [Gammaproteobacteria bacterium]